MAQQLQLSHQTSKGEACILTHGTAQHADVISGSKLVIWQLQFHALLKVVSNGVTALGTLGSKLLSDAAVQKELLVALRSRQKRLMRSCKKYPGRLIATALWPGEPTRPPFTNTVCSLQSPPQVTGDFQSMAKSSSIRLWIVEILCLSLQFPYTNQNYTQLEFSQTSCPHAVHHNPNRTYSEWPQALWTSTTLCYPKKACNAAIPHPQIRNPQKPSVPWFPWACSLQRNLRDLTNWKMSGQPKCSMTISCNSQVKKEDSHDQKDLNNFFSIEVWGEQDEVLLM